MDSRLCEKLVPDGIRLYQLLADSDISPVVHILSGQETDAQMQAYFEEAGFNHIQETVVMGLALNGSKEQVILIRANAMHSTFRFLQTLWHEMGHFSFRKSNPGLFFDLMSDPARLWFCPMMEGIVLKFWDEAVAQSASNRVFKMLPNESRDILCPDAQQQIEAERNTMHYFLKRCLNQGQIDFDVPLLKLLGIPFSPYCLAIYCAEAAANPWNDFLTEGCQCDDCAFRMDLVQRPIFNLVELVRQQHLSDAPFVITDVLVEKTSTCFVELSKALGADDKDIEMMGASLAELMPVMKQSNIG